MKEFCNIAGADEAVFDEHWGFLSKENGEICTTGTKESSKRNFESFDQVEGYTTKLLNYHSSLLSMQIKMIHLL